MLSGTVNDVKPAFSASMARVKYWLGSHIDSAKEKRMAGGVA